LLWRRKKLQRPGKKLPVVLAVLPIPVIVPGPYRDVGIKPVTARSVSSGLPSHSIGTRQTAHLFTIGPVWSYLFLYDSDYTRLLYSLPCILTIINYDIID